ncbi:LysR family transcriptional regulator [Bradyrhizobium tropiciagri]|uniref:LysR family transcriptional regulator n=1 Tax=Bradyrhizobium tropiciagri TaxID=312253 RepID=UPI001BAC1A29|nr:LysR family transcriptional regulator [Bradyrhizobium tropiciagri]MBR0899036.1 LysR family transcriptional regulator [Bradyrhizobium tropiciagri]
MDIDATPYRIFVTLADELSFTRASALLNVSQPALSARVREFERRLGFALFSRTSRRVELTPQGRLFLPNARRMVTEAAWAHQAAREIRENDLRIGAPFYTLHIEMRRRLVDRLIVDCPKVQLRIFDKAQERNYADLIRREIDLALLVEPSDTRTAATDAASQADWPDGLERLPLETKRAALLVPAEHRWAKMKEIPHKELRDQRIAMVNRALGAPLTVALSRCLLEAGAKLVRPPEAHAIAVERFGLLTGVPAVTLGWFDTHRITGQRNGVVRQIEGMNFSTTLSLIRLQGDQRPSAAMVWDMVRMEQQGTSGRPGQRQARKVLSTRTRRSDR